MSKAKKIKILLNSEAGDWITATARAYELRKARDEARNGTVKEKENNDE
jgi:hypothetical protein